MGSAASVSVIIPAYNHAPLVARAIESVLDQTHAGIDLIVIDDGSRDSTWEAIGAVHARRGGFRCFTQTNRGVSATLNAGMRLATGAFVGLLASDDYFLPDKIERQLALFDASPPVVGLVHCGAYEDRGDGALIEIRGAFVPAEGACFHGLLARAVTAIAPSILFRRAAFDATPGFDERLVGEDRDFYVALTAAGWEFRYDPAPLMVKTAGEQNLSSQVERYFNDPFQTLAKYRDRLQPDEYARIETGFYLGMGRAAAGVGKMGLAWRCYRTAARRMGSPGPLASFVGRAARHGLLGALPPGWRAALRAARARRAG